VSEETERATVGGESSESTEKPNAFESDKASMNNSRRRKREGESQRATVGDNSDEEKASAATKRKRKRVRYRKRPKEEQSEVKATESTEMPNAFDSEKVKKEESEKARERREA
jgi:hypothetical protein